MPETFPDWRGASVVVAATGPSLTPAVAAACRAAQRRGWRIMAVNDAYRLLPSADALYACDGAWWAVHKGAPEFTGSRWTSTSPERHDAQADVAKTFGLGLIPAREGATFRADGICYGGSQSEQSSNSGFQAVNAALLWGGLRVVLVGFDMRRVDGKGHFFGEHPRPLPNNSPYKRFVAAFTTAAAELPNGVTVINATRGSALKAFPIMSLARALGFVEADAAGTSSKVASTDPVGAATSA